MTKTEARQIVLELGRLTRKTRTPEQHALFVAANMVLRGEK